MTFFESLLILMLAAILLLQISRRSSFPYPALLAAAGVVVALIPGSPTIEIEPQTYLALFIAPVLVDAAFDFPPGAMRRYFGSLVVYAIVAVALTAGVVAYIAHITLGLPIAAGIALGAVVAPPDAAAATAILRRFSLPLSITAVLQGESLFNDSTALLLYGGALTVLSQHTLTAGGIFRLGAEIPGGLIFGILCAYIGVRAIRYLQGTLGGNVMQFVLSYLVWIAAVHLGLSAVLATVAFAMTMSRMPTTGMLDARMRVQSYAVWSIVVFTLNVLAFLLMGMQARRIWERLNSNELAHACRFALLVVIAVTVIRILVVLLFEKLRFSFNRARQQNRPFAKKQSLFIGWCGMRGFVTMSTALALPASFPQRDTATLTAFAVVVATLVFQGLTLAPLIRLLGLDRSKEAGREMAQVQAKLAAIALSSIQQESGPEADNLRFRFGLQQSACSGTSSPAAFRRFRQLGLHAVQEERKALEEIRLQREISVEAYLELQEQLDWSELTMLPDAERRIEEI
ncbi:MAG TPA: sodium:proton antiporter [Edaphobacter sp.]|jgi:CPA1 family monovalent cation:H+ antiporter